MQLTFEDLATQLPAGSIEFVGNNQLKINFSQITGDNNLTLQSSVIEPAAKYLQSLVDLTTVINEERMSSNPLKEPITFASKTFEGTPEKPEILYEIRFAINPVTFIENLFDPTAE